MAHDASALYDAAWRRLRELVDARNLLIVQLDQTICRAPDASLENGAVAEVDTAYARSLLDEIDKLTPQIAREIERANGYSTAAGRRKIRWVNQRPRRNHGAA